ncbi:MAG: NADH-quinone oxidoreductase subunit J [Nitriliruptorales bacterium]|nr:NADH-quinone oxidoreductase subunit J [Nitriliruptorales bacterium]
MTLLAQATEASSGANVAEVILFVCFGALAVGTAIAVVTMRNVVHAALMLVVNLLSIAGLYLALQASFLSFVQVIVFAGAFVVLFLFVIFLLGVDRDDLLVDRNKWHVTGAVVGGLLLAGLLVTGFVGTYTTSASRCGDQGSLTADDVRAGRVGCVGLDQLDVAVEPPVGSEQVDLDPTADGTSGAEFLGQRLFTRHTFVFEAAGLLLVVATIGALVLGKRHDDPPDTDPAYELAYEPPSFDEDLDLDDDEPGDDEVVADMAGEDA